MLENTETSIFSLIENIKLPFENFEVDYSLNKNNLQAIGLALCVEEEEALVFSVIFQIALEESSKINVPEIAEKVGLSNFEFYKKYGAILALEKKGLIEIERGKSSQDVEINLPSSVFNLIISGTQKLNKLSNEKSFFQITQHVIHTLKSVITSDYDLMSRITSLEDIFKDSISIEQIQWMEESKLSLNEKVILCCAVNMKVKRNENLNLQELLPRLFFSIDVMVRERNLLFQGKHGLIKLDMIELEEDILGEQQIKLTSQAEKLLCSEAKTFKVEQKIEPNFASYFPFSEQKKKKMFFANELSDELGRISKILSSRNFAKFQKRKNEMGLTPGLNVLFYGAPGTGKTEMVKQISIITKRDIFMVDIESIKDKMVGESEKRLKGVFMEYQNLKKELKRTPILLFNEADAILGKRMSVNSSVDQMNNSMQNILLQALENFDGILMATTNLKDSMDKAFDRRFTMKIKFEEPTKEAQLNILNSKLKDVVTPKQIKSINSKYSLTGGQIDNILANVEIKTMLGETISDDFLMTLCSNESKADSSFGKNSIGFVQDYALGGETKNRNGRR